MRRTKIVCTIGPATAPRDMLAGLVRRGMNVARFNFAHGTREWHGSVIRALREVSAELGEWVAILQDLGGPKIRTGSLRGGGPVLLQDGKRLTITTRPIEGDGEIISTTYLDLPRDVRPGDRILLDDGRMELRAEAVEGTEVRCLVVRGGMLGEHKGINLPAVRISAPALTSKDLDDLRFGLEQGVDYVGVSFVRSARDIMDARRAMVEYGRSVPIIAKLEKPEAIEHLGEILRVADGVMVARGDLGVEMSLEKVPILQKQIIARANEVGIPVITATQMLESMISSPRPTRAEASDVANAVFDGSDALMLSGETSIGSYPIEALEMMDRIVIEAEASTLGCALPQHPLPQSPSIPYAVAHAAYQAAIDAQARAISAFTQTGYTALLASKFRPRVPIVAVTPSEETARRVALYWGVTATVAKAAATADEILDQVEASVIRSGLVRPGDTIIIVARAAPEAWGPTNLLKVHQVGGG